MYSLSSYLPSISISIPIPTGFLWSPFLTNRNNYDLSQAYSTTHGDTTHESHHVYDIRAVFLPRDSSSSPSSLLSSSSSETETETDLEKRKEVVRHYCFLVHGWMGNDSEMSYIESSLLKSISTQCRIKDDPTQNAVEFVIHKTLCNNANTSDGIANGGKRLAIEIKNVLASPVSNSKFKDDESSTIHKTISFVGNSLGGLYARYAIGELYSKNEDTKWNFNVFCTTATPHLGCSSHTYFSIPRTAERVIGTVMQQTGKDLFRNHPENTSNDETGCLIRTMGLDSKYILPLSLFRKRIAYANAFMTDFQVPTATAAFLCEESFFPHHVILNDQNKNNEKKDFILATFETKKHDSLLNEIETKQSWNGNYSPNNQKNIDYLQLSNSLDAIGWTKVFVDVRDLIPLPKVSIPSFAWRTQKSIDTLRHIFEKTLAKKMEQMQLAQVSQTEQKEINDDVTFESKDLVSLFCPPSTDSVPLVPLGHTVMVANSKSNFYKRINKRGEAVVDHLSAELVDDMLRWNVDASQ